VLLSDGTTIMTRTVVWGGGESRAMSSLRRICQPGTVAESTYNPTSQWPGHPRVYVLGDAANIPHADGKALPQLGSVAQQSGAWAAQNILDEMAGKERADFRYKDKGIMAMIGRNAAIAEMGAHRHEVEGPVAFAAWLGVHAALLSGTRNKIDAFIAWGWDYFSSDRAIAIVDRTDDARIDWGDDDQGERPEFDTEQAAASPPLGEDRSDPAS
jgi:NADH:ubiquinone reductase (H+-translocating)